jgi:hypothetical protein
MFGAISHIKITYQNDSFDIRNRQVPPALPIVSMQKSLLFAV